MHKKETFTSRFGETRGGRVLQNSKILGDVFYGWSLTSHIFRKNDNQKRLSADFLKVLPNSAQDNIISFLQRSDQSIDFSRVLRAFVASSAKLQLHLRLMRETFHFLLPNKGTHFIKMYSMDRK